MGFWVEVGKASVYQVLKRLEREGSIAGRTQEGTDGPDRRVYRLTRQGRQRLGAGLAERWSALAPYETDAGVALGFSHLVPAAEARAAIDDRARSRERSVGRGPHRDGSDEGRRGEWAGGLQRHAHQQEALAKAELAWLKSYRAALMKGRG
jgi:DNA-binding PadR family transcriptional regulator